MARTARRRVAIALALLALVAHVVPAPGATGEAASASSAPDTTTARTLDDILSELQSRNARALSAESRTFDAAYLDSVSAAYDSTVAADGLAHTLETNIGGRGGGGGGVRTGFSLSPEDSRLDYTKVDGLTAGVAAHGYLTALGLRAQAGGRIGYAFGSERERHDAGVELSARGVVLGWAHREVTERFGITDVHGHRLFALSGSDEHDYLEREGWHAYLTLPYLLPSALETRLTFRREDESARRARDYFTLAERGGLFESNVQATEGKVRAVRLDVGRTRLDHPDLWGRIGAETAGRDLGGDLAYDRLDAQGGVVHRLPWDDELAVGFFAQTTAAPDGELPVQVLADLAGRSGVRGYPHRSIVGSHALLARIDYRVATDLFAAARIPLLRRAKLQLVPFIDVGAAWTPGGAMALSRSTLPASDDWKWGAGLGIRRNVGFGELLSHVRLDAAIRLDRTGAEPVVYFVLENEPFD